MLRLSTACRDARLRQVAFRLFQEDQAKTNETLATLSAVQRRTVVQRLFKALPPTDMERLNVRAAAVRAQMKAEDLDLPTAVKGARAKRKGPEITAYEAFVMDQSRNPAILALANPRDRETQLMTIYQSLPDKAKEVWEQRAEHVNAQPAPPAPKRKPAKSSRKPRRRSPRAKAAKLVKGKAAATKQKRQANTKGKLVKRKQPAAKKPRALTAYTSFVREQMALLVHLPQPERLAEVGKRWRALSTEERATRAATTATTDAPSVVVAAAADTVEKAETNSAAHNEPTPSPPTVAPASEAPEPNPTVAAAAAAVTSEEPGAGPTLATAVAESPAEPVQSAEAAEAAPEPPLPEAASPSPELTDEKKKKKKKKKRIVVKKKEPVHPPSAPNVAVDSHPQPSEPATDARASPSSPIDPST